VVDGSCGGIEDGPGGSVGVGLKGRGQLGFECARVIYAVSLGEHAEVSVLALTRSGSVIGAQQGLAVKHTSLVWSLVSTFMNAGRCSPRLLVTVGARVSRSRTPFVSQGRCSRDNEVDRHLVPL